MSKKLRIGIVGCGLISGRHIKAYEAIPDVELVAFCDVDESKVEDIASGFLARVYRDYREMFDRERLHGISVCTPPSSHKEIILAGINVLSEKPLSTNTEDAKDMVMMAEQNNCLLMTAFKFRFFQEVNRAKRLLTEGKIGKVLLAKNMFGSCVDMSKRWFSQKGISGGGVLLDNGSHAIDLFRYLLGEVKNVSARTNTFIQNVKVEESAVLLLEMKKGALATIDLSWSIPVPSDYYIEIYGSKGTILIGWSGVRYKTSDEDWIELKNDSEARNPFIIEIEHFTKCIKGEEKPIVTGLDGLRVQEVIEAAYDSISSKDYQEVKIWRGVKRNLCLVSSCL